MSRKMTTITAAAFAAALTFTGAGAANAYTGTPLQDGLGFVGKGEVQTPWGWNNKTLQSSAPGVSFSVSSTVDHEWTCVKTHIHPVTGVVRETTQERAAVTTTQGLISSVARENSKGKDGAVTGFHLTGFSGSLSEQTDGPAVGSCPADQSEFVEGSIESAPRAGGGVFAHYLELESITLQDTNPVL